MNKTIIDKRYKDDYDVIEDMLRDIDIAFENFDGTIDHDKIRKGTYTLKIEYNEE